MAGEDDDEQFSKRCRFSPILTATAADSVTDTRTKEDCLGQDMDMDTLPHNQLLYNIDEEPCTSSDFECVEQGCWERFPTLADLEHHYLILHKFVCQACGKALSSNRLLKIHLTENHDPFFQTLAAKSPQYVCFLEKCPDKFMNDKSRKTHMIETHHYPGSIREVRRRGTNTQQGDSKPYSGVPDVVSFGEESTTTFQLRQ